MPPQRHVPSAPSGPPAGSRRVVRRLLTLVAAVAVGAGMVAAPAHAAPSVDEIDAQIDKQWEKLEPTIEDYNKVRSQLKVNKKKSADLQKKMVPLELASTLAMNKVGDIAARYYMRGPSQEMGALLVSTKPGTLAEQLVMLDRVADDQRRQIASVLAARDKYNAQKQKLDRLIATEQQQEAKLASQKKQIDAEIKRLTGMLPVTSIRPAGCPKIDGVVSSAARTAIKTACAQVGDPYVWGATGPNSFDCSGLTQYAYKAAGISLTHFTGAQWNEGRKVSRSEARPGDLVFFGSDLHHVGLYLGNGVMVHAPRTGKPVQVSSISTQPLAGFVRVG
ncbi:C40 family peptidase [Micromonospora sp. WMMD998]|uniref:C40 family peptidase n=1 Tax=Micromonospora sp. WMMD998 TaxID=3016092 RepID=UPI00249C3CF3|nr:C40 family peptidase [Micromonospora sp. WMMD998]WFE37684.1 NlpC/P60 family protein [Micromonospora sp. WMMD998]